MADANMVMDRADMLVAVHGFSQAQVDAADENGLVGTRHVEGVGEVSYYVTLKGTAVLPDQMGDQSH